LSFAERASFVAGIERTDAGGMVETQTAHPVVARLRAWSTGILRITLAAGPNNCARI